MLQFLKCERAVAATEYAVVLAVAVALLTNINGGSVHDLANAIHLKFKTFHTQFCGASGGSQGECDQ